MTERTTLITGGAGWIAGFVATSPVQARLSIFDGKTKIGLFLITEGVMVRMGQTYPLHFHDGLYINLRRGLSRYGRLLSTDKVKIDWHPLVSKRLTMPRDAKFLEPSAALAYITDEFLDVTDPEVRRMIVEKAR